jgi:hypothetical protein
MKNDRLRTAKERLFSFARAAVVPGALLVSAGAFAGCTAEVEPAVAPVGVYYYDYPYTYYEGRPVYLVNGHWYYSYGNRWYYYRRTPGELRGHVTLHYPPHRYGHGGGPVWHRR